MCVESRSAQIPICMHDAIYACLLRELIMIYCKLVIYTLCSAYYAHKHACMHDFIINSAACIHMHGAHAMHNMLMHAQLQVHVYT